MLKGVGLQTMPCWYYEKKELRHTPSMLQGMQVDQENSFRREGARFILQVGNKMGLKFETMATGVVYFHRFYMVHTFQEFPRHVTACCCLFLAGKVEETPKKCKDIMKTARSLISDATWAEFGDDSREEVMTLERILLQTIKFDFIVDHPYTYLLKYAKCLKGDKKKLHNIVQMAWTFVNDSLCTTLCLQWEPEIIAVALMYLAGKLHKFEVNDWAGKTVKHQKWWDIFVQGISLELLEDICHQVLDLYSANKAEGFGPGPAPEGLASMGKPKAVESAKRPPPAAPIATTTAAAIAAADPSPPPAKKHKKEEGPKNFPSPAKTAPDTPTAPGYSTYQQQATTAQQYGANFPPAYPPPPSAAATTPTPSSRYPYTYQPPPAPPRYPPTCSTPQPPPPPATPPVSTTASSATQQPIYHAAHYAPISPYTASNPPTPHYPQPASQPVTPTHRPPPPNFPPPHVATPYFHAQTPPVAPRPPHYQQPSTPYGSTYTPRGYYPPT